jgi:hypothetical protein
MTTKKKEPAFTDYNKISVPIAFLRLELAQLNREGFETIPLGELLKIVTRAIQYDKEKG